MASAKVLLFVSDCCPMSPASALTLVALRISSMILDNGLERRAPFHVKPSSVPVDGVARKAQNHAVESGIGDNQIGSAAEEYVFDSRFANQTQRSDKCLAICNITD